ncbi:MAG: pyruvate dehydrogenase complex dihydrolipoamide acetyltransferase [Pseudomonadota bacterium]
MPVNILMPALSPTMEEGTLARWLKKEGDSISSGDVIAEIETDKATMEFEAVGDGKLGKIIVPDGTEGVRVNQPIAILLEDGESATDIQIGLAAVADPIAKPSNKDLPNGTSAGSAAARDLSEVRASTNGEKGARRVFASPLARRIAADRGIDLETIIGSGPHGRIVKADLDNVRTAAEVKPLQDVNTSQCLPPALEADAIKKIYADRSFADVSLDGMRKTIAARLTEAKRDIPHFYLRREIRLDALLEFRAQLNADLASRGIKLSVNDFIIKASALALVEVADCNAVFAGDRILKFERADIAVAVAIDGGLYTPVIRDADQKTISAISQEMKDLATRARSRQLKPHEYQGGSFAISNLGMYGIESFDAVINPPHGSILAVGAGIEKPIVNEAGDIESATMMMVTLSVDHRVIDGALGAQWLERLKRGLENPLALLA